MKHRRAAKIDTNQPDIVKALRRIPGVTVEVGHDDILVGFQKRTYWFEIKAPELVTKAGNLPLYELTPSEVKRLDEWQGHYQVVTTIDHILKSIGIA